MYTYWYIKFQRKIAGLFTLEVSSVLLIEPVGSKIYPIMDQNSHPFGRYRERTRI